MERERSDVNKDKNNDNEIFRLQGLSVGYEGDVIKLDGLSVGYESDVIVKDIDLTIKKGEIVTLIGPNGAGKSTILKTISKQESRFYSRRINATIVISGRQPSNCGTAGTC